jgi:hypothetical protein
MKKSKLKKLSLSRETLRSLLDPNLHNAAGGFTNGTHYCCSSPCSSPTERVECTEYLGCTGYQTDLCPCTTP